MAIDTTAKLASALYFVGHRKGRLTPTVTIAGADFQDIVGFYRGILAAEPADPYQTVTLLSATVPQPAIVASIPQPTVTVSTPQSTITITEKNDIR